MYPLIILVQSLSWLCIIVAIDEVLFKQQSCGLAGMYYIAELNADALSCKETYVPVL